MVAVSDGSLTRRGSQGALALLALRREAASAGAFPCDDRYGFAMGDKRRSPLPSIIVAPFCATGPLKVRTKQARYLQQQQDILEQARSSSRISSDPEYGNTSKLESKAEGRQHAGTAFAALTAQQHSAVPSQQQPAVCDGFSPLPAFGAYLDNRREKSQEGKARFAGLSTSVEYAALLRVRRDQDVHCIRKKGKKPASERVSAAEQPGDPQRRYYLRSGNWELAECELTGEPVLCRWVPSKNGQGVNKQVWVHEGNVEIYLWHIHHRQLNHAGMDKTWAEVQKQLYGCTQSLCRVYVVSCQCVQTKARHKRKASVHDDQFLRKTPVKRPSGEILE